MTTSNPTIKETVSNTEPLFTTDYKVYINHTDAGGIVYHANHLVFFENCRRDWFTQLGLNGYFLQTDNGQLQHFVVSQVELQYKQAILLDEIISVCINKVELRPASIVFHQSIHRHSNNTLTNIVKTSDTLLSSTKIVIACVQNQLSTELIANNDHETVAHFTPMRPIRVPEKLRHAIEQAIKKVSFTSKNS